LRSLVRLSYARRQAEALVAAGDVMGEPYSDLPRQDLQARRKTRLSAPPKRRRSVNRMAGARRRIVKRIARARGRNRQPPMVGSIGRWLAASRPASAADACVRRLVHHAGVLA